MYLKSGLLCFLAYNVKPPLQPTKKDNGGFAMKRKKTGGFGGIRGILYEDREEPVIVFDNSSAKKKKKRRPRLHVVKRGEGGKR
jgi:hypothetical protein